MSENEWATGWACPLLDHCERPILIGPMTFDDDAHQRGERINGSGQCPRCGLHWPLIEEPDEWTQDKSGRWLAAGWWGAVVCPDCGMLLIEQPDGRCEAYSLREGN